MLLIWVDIFLLTLADIRPLVVGNNLLLVVVDVVTLLDVGVNSVLDDEASISLLGLPLDTFLEELDSAMGRRRL